MPGRRLLLCAGAVAAGALAVPRLRAQPRFPERPLTWMVPFAPGGIADLCARAVAEALGPLLGQTVVVDNRPSAGSIVASQAVAQARPDGHTLLLMSNANAVSVGLFKRLPYDPVADFAPVGTVGTFDLGVFAAAGSRWATLADAVTHARAHPGRLTVGTITPGSTQHLAARLFETVAGIEALVVPYKGSPAVLTALRSGEIDLAFEVLGPMLAQAAAGVVRVLAVSSGRRNPALPGVPTVQQAGIAGYDVASWNAMAAPRNTPPEVLQRLSGALNQALAQPALQQRLAGLGVRAQPGTPAELQALLQQEIRRWGQVIRAARIEPE
ncbi:Bug family tripartite tricarboxylate transporter substrate binding protein [Pseudorhodoferax sp.]|uniref:Bug family tripartite tricarboxylate transporter substrate binding protein n=1 Tax=Pseudorhodoferax sp. TaxID=1993553 RepID=UPI002DD6B20E|nr:tripartite tricarboxylate transporter substrate binding protein [Pseudorhodoferax sp.]